ncbi:MAG TPA: OmpA family protein [Deltaproteobacteria bacterium]|nr:OmpA family protein [Deltaproteobacteria bacterium]
MTAGVCAVFFLFSLSGCAELKQLRIETADQKTMIEELTRENETCRGSLSLAQSQLKLKEAEVKTLESSLKGKDAALKAKETALREKEVKAREQSDSFMKMQEAMKAELDSKQVALKELEGKLTLTMVESILFDSGKADVKPEGVEALRKVSEVLKNTTDQEIVVAGYTDNVQITGRLARTYPSNWELSAARAISVVKILVAEGVDPKHLSAAGYGEHRPVADNATPEGRAKNRRMEIVLMPKRT